MRFFIGCLAFLLLTNDPLYTYIIWIPQTIRPKSSASPSQVLRPSYRQKHTCPACPFASFDVVLENALFSKLTWCQRHTAVSETEIILSYELAKGFFSGVCHFLLQVLRSFGAFLSFFLGLLLSDSLVSGSWWRFRRCVMHDDHWTWGQRVLRDRVRCHSCLQMRVLRWLGWLVHEGSERETLFDYDIWIFQGREWEEWERKSGVFDGDTDFHRYTFGKEKSLTYSA